jgi:hypothetical protein
MQRGFHLTIITMWASKIQMQLSELRTCEQSFVQNELD